MRSLGPGIYDDGRGGMHVDLDEIVESTGREPTPENKRAVARAIREIYNGPIIEMED